MSRTRPRRPTRAAPTPAGRTVSLASLVAYPLVIAALLVAISHPVAAVTAAVGAVVAFTAARAVLPSLVRRVSDTPRHVRVPGVGTVTVRVSPA